MSDGPTTADITVSLLHHLKQGLAMPRFTPHRWWECDVAHLTTSGYFREFEIKVSRTDFLRDREKSRWVSSYVRFGNGNSENKYRLLEEGDPRGPVEFWYVVPEGLITPDELPPWAGLMYVAPRPWTLRVTSSDDGCVRCHTLYRKTAPKRLHRSKAAAGFEQQMLKASYYRFRTVEMLNRGHLLTDNGVDLDSGSEPTNVTSPD